MYSMVIAQHHLHIYFWGFVQLLRHVFAQFGGIFRTSWLVCAYERPFDSYTFDLHLLPKLPKKEKKEELCRQ